MNNSISKKIDFSFFRRSKKMKISCNGCRVLRKGCSENCPFKPSLGWIGSSQAQANATVFLAKFYGRAGLINLLNAAPTSLRHEIYRSLLEEACGRIVNPITGSVGLFMAGKWKLCEEAVEKVLNGIPITEPGQIIKSFNGSDIRHFSKNGDLKIKTRKKFKRNHNGASTSQPQLHGDPEKVVAMELLLMNDLYRTPSNESIASVETLEGSLLKKKDQPGPVENNNPNDEMDLKLTLGSYSQLSALAKIATEGEVYEN